MRKGKSRQEILEKAGIRFFIQPFSRLTSSEIAAQTGVSKRTFYKYFPSKESFLEEVVQKFQNDILEKISGFEKSESDVVKRMQAIAALMQKTLSSLGITFIEDIQKHYPAVWIKMDDFRTKHATGKFEKFIKEGKRKGQFRDIDPFIASRAFIGAMRAVVNPQVLVNLPVSADEAVKTIFSIFLDGIKK